MKNKMLYKKTILKIINKPENLENRLLIKISEIAEQEEAMKHSE
jgi:hypothetical protein